MKNLIHEIHRRSLWQVVTLYLGAGWIALQVVESVTNNAGLPDWVPGFAVVLLVIGFPIVIATALVQEGLPGGQEEAGPQSGAARSGPGDEGGQPSMAASPANLAAGTGVLDRPSTRSGMHRKIFTWRNALLGGVAAFALLGLAVAGYFVMRVAGIGPVASLVAQGVIEEGEPILIAEFENSSDDPSLSGVVTEALRVDLAGSPALTPLAPSRVREILRLMQQSPDEPFTPALAREVAIREGIEAVLEGEVASAGSGYILLASLREPETRTPLATFRRTARGPDEVIAAIDRLSQDIREKAGESLRSIRDEPPLSRVTTPSLEALRKYVEAVQLEEAGDQSRALALLREAVALDSAFAMAHRKIAALEFNARGITAAAVAAATRAYELRDHLTELERLHTTAFYHLIVTGDVDAQIEAYERVLAAQPDDRVALSNLANVVLNRTRYEEAAALLRRAVGGPGRSWAAAFTLPFVLASLPDPGAAQTAMAEFQRNYPGLPYLHLLRANSLAMLGGDYAEAHAVAARLAGLPDAPPMSWLDAAVMHAEADAARGRLAEARRHLAEMVSRARQESPASLVQVHTEHALIERLFGTPAAARDALEAALQALDGVPAGGRATHFFYLSDEAIRLGDAALAGRVLERWQAEAPLSARGSQFEELQRLVGVIEMAATEPAGAAAELEAFRTERRCPRCYSFLTATLQTRAGQMRRAAAAWEEVIAKPGDVSTLGLLPVLAHERLGDIYEALGEPVKAAQHYARFAELWKDADPELQPRVRHARERAAALWAEGG